MPSVTLNRKVVEQLVGKKLPLDKLKHAISYLGTDLEGIEGDEINVEIFPNRPDLLSEQGLARALASFLGVKKGLRSYTVKKSGKKVVVDASVKMRPYTACAIVRGVDFTDERIREIMQIQEKLAMTHGRNRKKSAYGLYPTSAMYFPINYAAKDPKKVEFWPLGMPREMRADDVEELHPKGREYKWIADEWKKEGHKKYPFFTDAKNHVLCMLPYTNSHDTGKVDESTKEVFIECTGTDFDNVSTALNIFVTMLADMGGEILSLDIEYPDKTVTTPVLEPTQMTLDVAEVNRLLGLSLQPSDAASLLERMGYGIKGKTQSKIHTLIPAYRADILHPVDLIEDIAIAYGYDTFKPTIPAVATVGYESPTDVLIDKLSNILVGAGVTETNAFIISSSESETEKVSKDILLITLKNPATKEYDCIRPWLTSSLLSTLQLNKRHEYPQHIFLAGRCAQRLDTKPGYAENEHLAVALCGDEVTFTAIKQMLDHLLGQAGISFSLEKAVHPTFIEGRVGKIVVDDVSIGYIGEIHPQVLINFELEMPVSVFELDVSALLRLIEKKKD
jgi:phenylalanyl-tRNA synthetase beta chain